MENKKTSVFAGGLIWFGAAVSIAEIFTGTLIAPLGFYKGAAAIVLGHIIGCILLCLAGLIGGLSGKSAMETVKMSFGQKGSLVFSLLNVLQLVGWTAVMIIQGGRAAAVISGSTVFFGSSAVWCTVIGILIIAWVFAGIKNLSRLNTAAMGTLFLLTIILSVVVFKNGISAATAPGGLSFGAAVELSVAMPLSWLPLISDYTRDAAKPQATSIVSSAVYFFVSCWMYIIGMSASIFTGESDIA